MSFFTSVLGSVLSIENRICTLRGHIAGNVVRQLREYGTAVRQVTEVVLEGSESGDHIAVQPERWHAIRDALLRVRDDACEWSAATAGAWSAWARRGSPGSHQSLAAT